MKLIICAVISYLIGSVSTGIILSHQRNMDIREHGSKSSGATNMTRILGINLGVATFIGDCMKGLVAVLIGQTLAGRMGGIIAGLFVVIGHNWPMYYRFQGGKGISTSCAVLLLLFPVEALVSYAAAIAIIYITRYISVGSMTLLMVSFLMTIGRYSFWPNIVFTFALFALGVWRHKTNIERLKNGTENRFSIPHR